MQPLDVHRKPIGRRFAAARAALTVPTLPTGLAGLAGLGLTVLLAGCGSGNSTEVVVPQAPASSTAPSTNLTVVFDDGAGKTDSWTLTCDPAGGTHPHAATACAALTANGKTALPPVAKGMMCTQIFGGAQRAKVTGTWNGGQVNAALSRTNGCEISRWKALEGLLPATGGVGVG